MNKNYLLIAVLMSVGMMTSCSSSDTEENTPVGNPAVVSLELNGKAMTRSAASDGEATISGGQAAAFDASGAIVGTVQSFLTSTSTTPTVKTTTQATQVSVVANPGTTASLSFGSILNKGGLEAVKTDLASTTADVKQPKSQDPTKLPKYGNSSVDFSTNTSVDQPVDMYNLVGKIKLNPIVIDFGGTAYDGANFEPKEVFLYDANTTSTFGGIGSDPQSGENTIKTGDDYAVIDPNSFYYLSSGVISSTTGTYTFYTFPNTSTTNPTKIVIKGAFTPKDGLPVLVYYPIVINRFQTGTVIKKGGTQLDEADANDSKIVKSTSYDVTITIKGKGVDSPASNISPASATITMNVKDWTDYTQEVTVK
ncbi:hypothetical protein [Prevotella sp.]|uniref:hypothetical protein n=1 Tax=Prevotella sp. TaxID=59823 RepID=UPI0026477055|nr:hypothetical protein [Prevotella sp.]MDN5554659.1 hypothetical protein [Prevotella sp.]